MKYAYCPTCSTPRACACGSYGRLASEEQTSVFAQEVRGRVVHDLGAGNLSLARYAIELGAAHVHAVDQRADWTRSRVPDRVEAHCTSFRKWHQKCRRDRVDIDLALVSWPSVTMSDSLIDLLRDSRRVLYLGKNTDGTSCGTPELWGYLRHREVLAHVPHPANTLLLYGATCPLRDLVYGEERGGLEGKRFGRIYSFEEST